MALLTEEDISKIAEKAFGGEGVRVSGHQVSRKSEENIGYLGKHLTLALDVSLEGKPFRRSFFVKTYDVKATGDDYLEETGIFKREVDFYRIVADDLRALPGAGEWCPEYFFSKERVLVLEDLTEKGFKMAADHLLLDKVHLQTALRTLASMHAASLAFEAQESKFLPAMYPTILRRDILYDENNLNAPSRRWISWQIEDLLEGIEYLNKYTPEEKREIRGKFRGEIMRIYSLSKKSDKYRNVLTHGDMWRNNLLFRYSSQNLPVDCRFVDFQFVRYAPPAHDLMHLLHYATKKADRDREQSYYLRFYYQNLQRWLKDFEVNVEEMTEEELEESCREYKELALIQCLLSLHYLLGTVSLNADTETYDSYENYLSDHRKEYMRKFFDEDSYADRIIDIFHELVDDYIINK